MIMIMKSPAGQAALAFLRVFAAAVLASWLQAGTPITGLSGDLVIGWVELGLTAGVGLVLANYLGPWEPRYGNQGKVGRSTTKSA